MIRREPIEGLGPCQWDGLAFSSSLSFRVGGVIGTRTHRFPDRVSAVDVRTVPVLCKRSWARKWGRRSLLSPGWKAGERTRRCGRWSVWRLQPDRACSSASNRATRRGPQGKKGESCKPEARRGRICTIRRVVPGGRSPNGTVDHLPYRSILENHSICRRIAPQEKASASILGARCRRYRTRGGGSGE